MNLQQVVQPRSSTNGFGRRRVDREMGTRMESNLHSGKSISSNFHNAVNGGKIGGLESPSRDRLIYIVTSLIGHRVEVHVRNGSILSGFFYATNAEKDFGIVLKMAQVVKDGTVRGQKPVSDAAKKPQTMIIPARELVQVLAKDVSLSNDEHTDGHAHEKRQDLMIDSVISQSHRVEERELEPWRPDEDDPECPELENIFDGTWNRNWDQFETNETLFGVKSTFDEELYTTKLERGPQMREIEREASRIAREIEGEETRDLHLAEERGIHFHEDLELDEESRFSAVRREVDDGRFEENENTMLDVCNTETFGGSLDSVIIRSLSDISGRKIIDEPQASFTCSLVDEGASSRIPAGRDIHRDHFRQLLSDSESLSVDDLSRMDDNQIQDQEEVKNFLNECIERNTFEEAQTSKSKEIQPSQKMKGLSPSATAYAPSSSGQDIKHSVGESVESAVSGKASVAVEPVHPHVRPGSATSSTSERVVAGSVSSGPGLSPSSSVGSLSSEKSSLNPYAKEFKLNPNAKSFTPSAPSRPHMPISEGSFYYTSNIPAAPHMHSLPVGFGIGPSFGGPQPVVYNTQAAQMQPPQAYIHPNGPLYGQQMILGQPRPVMYMPSYPPSVGHLIREVTSNPFSQPTSMSSFVSSVNPSNLNLTVPSQQGIANQRKRFLRVYNHYSEGGHNFPVTGCQPSLKKLPRA